MTAKAEIANYSISTSFGGRKRFPRHFPIARPETRAEALSRIRQIYAENKWGKIEQDANHRLVGLPPREKLEDYADAELKLILGDMERLGMILFKEE